MKTVSCGEMPCGEKNSAAKRSVGTRCAAVRPRSAPHGGTRSRAGQRPQPPRGEQRGHGRAGGARTEPRSEGLFRRAARDKRRP